MVKNTFVAQDFGVNCKSLKFFLGRLLVRNVIRFEEEISWNLFELWENRKTWKIVHRPLPRDVTSPPPPPHPWEVYCIGFARVWSSCLASRNNMASNEEGSTHTRTIQKRAKKTQDQACQFDASLLEGERWKEIFFVSTQCLPRPENTMPL